jgi:hypothetical protein
MNETDDYEGANILETCGADAAKWAKAFRETALRLGYSDMDEGWLIGWFANAIEHSWDVRTGGGPVVLPDGSAFFVGSVG